MTALTTNTVPAPEQLTLAAPIAPEPSVKLPTFGEDTARELVQLFKLLADETRLRIMYYLMQIDELNVCTLCSLLGQSQPAVSHHLALLRVSGIIECRRDGKHNFYRLVPKRCQAFLDVVFAVQSQEPRKVRVEDSVITYERISPAVA